MQIVNFSTQMHKTDSQSLTLWDLFISSNPRDCFTDALLPFGNSHHVVVSLH